MPYPISPTSDIDDEYPLLKSEAPAPLRIRVPAAPRAREVIERRAERAVWLSVVLALLGATVHYSGAAHRLNTLVDGSLNWQAAAEPRIAAGLLMSDSPTVSFRENLVPGMAYTTAFHYGGFTNQLLSLIKLAYFAKLTDRVLLISDLYPKHHEGTEAQLSDFFDIPSWSTSINVSMVEWADVKLKDSDLALEEQLTCWGTRNEKGLQRYKVTNNFYAIDPKFSQPTLSFASLRLMLAQDQTAYLDAIEPKDNVNPRLAYPEEQLVCFDELFWVESLVYQHGKVDKSHGIEELIPYGPVWNEIGQHLHFNENVNREVDRVIASLLPDEGKLPEFIALHLMQGDFVGHQVQHDIIDEFVREEAAMQEKLAKRNARHSSSDRKLPVIVATDSNDQQFIDRLKALGWIVIDHQALDTRNRLGGWWPGVIDSAILSRAVGLVGTKLSTFSYTAIRRVETWQGGESAIVQGW